MEAKLAEFRKSRAQQKPSINWRDVISHFSSKFSSPFRKCEETKIENEINDDIPIPNETNWQIILIKFLVWLTLFVIFIRIEFGAIYFIISLLYFIWINLSSNRRHRNQLSAYSVFNPNFEKIQGTFSAEDYDRQLRRGGSPFFSS